MIYREKQSEGRNYLAWHTDGYVTVLHEPANKSWFVVNKENPSPERGNVTEVSVSIHDVPTTTRMPNAPQSAE